MRIKQPAEVYGELQVGKIDYPEFLAWADAFREMVYAEGYREGLNTGFMAGLDDEQEQDFPILELNGREIDDYEIDCFGLEPEEMTPDNLLFTYAEFKDKGKPLTDSQLYILSKKYPEVIARLVQSLLKRNG